MGESSGGGGDGQRRGATKSSFQRSVARAEAREKKRKQEEMAMLAQEEETGKSLFARSATSGSIIRSASSGRGVTNRAGRQAREDYRAAYEGRPARNMDAEFPMDAGGDDQPMEQVSGQSKLEPEKRTAGGPSRASRRLLAQGQMGAKTRQFY